MGRTSLYFGRPFFWVTRFWGTNFRYVYMFGVRVEWWRGQR